MNEMRNNREETAFDRVLFRIMHIFLLLTVLSTFVGSNVLVINVPVIGALYPFRVFLPITALLYLIWALRGNDDPWRDATNLERWAYIFCAVLILYGVVSIFRAIEVSFTFRRVFNICFDTVYFFLMLRLCRDRKVFRTTLAVAVFGMVVIGILGAYETHTQGLVNPLYDNFKRIEWFFLDLQCPVATMANTNDYAAVLIFTFAAFLAARSNGVFREKNWIVKYAVVLLLPLLFFLTKVSTSRLNIISFWILFAAVLLHDIFGKVLRKRVVALTLVLMLGVVFCHQYRYIVPPVQNYISKTIDRLFPEMENPISAPEFLYDKNDAVSLEEEFFSTDESGNTVLNDTDSGGIRTRLLIHAAKCFVESYGLGKGVGNTEILAARRTVIPRWEGQYSSSIHCFLARIIADYGIFVLIPLGAIIFLMLKGIWLSFRKARKEKDRKALVKVLLFFACVLIFPIASTASSEAQDCLQMWHYLAVMVLLARYYTGKDQVEELCLPPKKARKERMKIMDFFTEKILTPIGRLTNRFNEKGRDGLFMLACVLIYLQFFVRGTTNRYRYLLYFGAGCVLLAIMLLCTMSKQIRTVRFRPLLAVTWFGAGLLILLSGVRNSMDFLPEALLMVIVYPVVHLIWNSGDHSRIFRLLIRSTELSFVIYLVYTLIKYPITQVRYGGLFENMNSAAGYLGVVFVCELIQCLAVKKLDVKAILRFILLGLSVALTLYTCSRTGQLEILMAGLVAAAVCLINGRKAQLKLNLRNIGIICVSMVLFFNITAYIFQAEKIVTPILNGTASEEAAWEDVIHPSDFANLNDQKLDTDGKDLNEISTGRIDIWKGYASQLNLFGHEDTGTVVIEYNGEERVYHTAHMTLLQIAYESGIIAALLWLAFNISAGICSVLYALRRKDDPMAMVPLLFTIAYAVNYLLASTGISFWYMSTFLYCLVQFPLMAKEKKAVDCAQNSQIGIEG